MSNTTQLLPPAALAELLTRTTGKLADREELPPGEYEIDRTVRVRGTIKVGQDFQKSFWQSADPMGLLALALNKLNGVTVESIMREHLALKNDPVHKAEAKQIKEQVSTALKALSASAVKTAKGQVTVHNPSVEEVI